MAATETKGGVLRARLRRTGASAPGQATPAPVPPPPPASVERMAATAAARAARRAAGLPATAEAVAAQGVSLAELPELLPERALIAVIEAGGDRLGVVVLCPDLLASLIEMQAMGRVSTRPVEARRPTRADAALAAGFVNQLMEELGETLAALPGHAALAGYRYASHLDDPRPLALMLEDAGFRALRLTLRLGTGGERRGTLLVAIPATPAAASASAPPAAPAKAEAIAPPATHMAAESLAAAMRDAPVPVVGVLCRRQISLRELRALRPGATIALPRAALDGAWLETTRGQRLARAKLGEADGFHALRLRHRDAAGDVAAAPQAAAGLGRPAEGARLAPALPLEPPIDDIAAPDAFRPDCLDAAVVSLPLTVS